MAKGPGRPNSRRPPERKKPHHRPKTRFLPSVTAPADQEILPGVGELTITGYAPRIGIQDVDAVQDLSHEKVFVHEVVLPAYTYFSTVEGLEGIPIEVGSNTFRLSTAPLVGIRALILDPGQVTEEVPGRTPGLVTPAFGTVVYDNVEGQVESLMLGVPTDGAKVTCYYGPIDGEFPTDFAIDFVAYINGTPKFTKTEATVNLRDRSSLLDAMVSEQGFDHGLSDATGTRRRPIVYGTAGYPAPILYMPFELAEQGNVWFVQRNEPTDMDAVYDGGVQLINQGQASSINDLYAVTPNPSSYRWFYDTGESFAENRGTWMRLGSKVHVELRYYANSGTATVTELAIDAGIADAATMEDDSVDLEIGSRVIESQSYRDVFEDVAKANLSIIGFSRSDKLMQRYIVPGHSTDYDTTFTFTDGVNSTDWEVYANGGADRRIWEVKVNAGATQQGQLAGIPDLDGAAAAALSREQWLTSFVGSNSALLDDDPSAESMTLDIEANHFAGDEAAMQTYVEEVHALFGGIQVWTWLTARYDEDTAALKLMDRVTLSGSRMTTGKKGRIVSIERQLDPVASRIRFGIWTHYSTIPASEVELVSVDDGTTASGSGALSRGSKNVRSPEAAVIPCMADDDPIETIGIVRSWPDFPYPMRLASISASVNTAQESGSLITVEVFVDDVSAFSVPITIDNGDTKSDDATTPSVLAITEIRQGQKVRIQVTNYGDGTGQGLVVTFKGIQ